MTDWGMGGLMGGIGVAGSQGIYNNGGMSANSQGVYGPYTVTTTTGSITTPSSAYWGQPIHQYQYQGGQYYIGMDSAAEHATSISELPEETMVAAVVGWRSWSVSPFTDELRSFNGTVWTPYEWLKAKCSASTCGGLRCSCGIYSWKTQKHVPDGGYAVGATPEGKYQRVYGEVYLKGHILQCKDGFRSSHAYPKAFVDTGVLARRMAQVYGVPLIPEEESLRTKLLPEKVQAQIDAALETLRLGLQPKK